MIKSLFEGVKNVGFVGEAVYGRAGQDVKMKTVVLEEPDTDRWNALAERTNTASFIRMTGKQPKDYTEVQAWVKSLSSDKEKAVAGTTASQFKSVTKSIMVKL